MIVLRDYQADLEAKIYQSWDQGARNVLAVLPTGGGKTVVFAKILSDHQGAACAIAHRQELVSQISLALARNAVRHNIIAPKNVIQFCVSQHMAELQCSFFDPSARIAVAGVDTLVKRKDLGAWLQQVTLVVQDEAHHVQDKNKWGKAAQMFPNAKGLGVTATPLRADGKGLGRSSHGLMDVLVEGPSMRDLINAGHLTDYRIFCPSNDIDFDTLKVSAGTGDYTPQSVHMAVEKSQIMGDVVEHYKRLAMGKLGVTFASDVAIASEIAAKYNMAGVPAEVVSAKTPNRIRQEIIRRFANRDLLQLVNVDLFGEGFDLPAIEVVSFVRPTKSFAVYAQQFGRALRPLEGKGDAIIIDHVGNVVQHNVPDAQREWSLAPRGLRDGPSRYDDVMPVTACPKCTGVYARIYSECPYCGYKPEPQERSAPEFVDGDLAELDPEVLAKMRGDQAKIDGAAIPPGHLTGAALGGYQKAHRRRQHAQAALRESMCLYAQLYQGEDESQLQRRFYINFGVDMLSAKSLGRPDAFDLADRLNDHLRSHL